MRATKTFKRSAAQSVLLIVGLSGCIFDGPMTEASQEFDVWIEEELAVSHSTGEGILRLVNDPTVDSYYLEVEGGISAVAAENVVAHRQGADGLDGTSDDDPFDNLFELDGVRYVDTLTLISLGELAQDLDLIPALILEGVPFSHDEQNRTLLFANFATFHELDAGASLDVRAVEGLVHGRPYEELLEVAERPFIGPSSLQSMRDFSGAWLDSRLADED